MDFFKFWLNCVYIVRRLTFLEKYILTLQQVCQSMPGVRMFEEKTFYIQFGKRHFEASTVAVSQSMPGVRKLGKNLAAFLFPASGKMADVQNKQ